jgi:hypothetical protein
MNILYLGSDSQYIHYNHWYGFDFILSLNYSPNVNVKLYGMGLDTYYEKYIVRPYSEKTTLQDLKNMFNFDVLILSNKNRIFYKNNNLIDKNFKTLDCVKISIEGDFHQHRTNPIWFDNGICAIFHRHKNSVLLGKKLLPQLKHFWLPCSVDTNVFYPKNTNRINKIAFIGHYDKANKILSLPLIKKYLGFCGTRYDNEYIDILQKYKIYLNYSYNTSIDNARAFEILASGGILLTNQCNNGFQDLFGEQSFFTYENNDIIAKINFILNNKNLQQIYIDNALKIITTKHTHQCRGQYLLNTIKSL